MKRIGICLLLAAGIQSSCIAEVTKLPIEHRKVLEDSSRFREILAAAKLPPAIIALCGD
jgi:hypothetical protein